LGLSDRAYPLHPRSSVDRLGFGRREAQGLLNWCFYRRAGNSSLPYLAESAKK